MTKQKAVKKPVRGGESTVRTVNWQKWVVGLIVITLATTGFVVVKNIQYNRRVDRERAEFMAAKADLHNLAQQITKEVGQPTQLKEVQDCNYASRDFGLGPLSCNVMFSLDLPQKNTDIKIINNMVENSLQTKLRDNSMNIPLYDDIMKRVFVFKSGQLSCGIEYLPAANDKYSIRMDCDGSAMKPYFPVTDGSDYLP